MRQLLLRSLCACLAAYKATFLPAALNFSAFLSDRSHYVKSQNDVNRVRVRNFNSKRFSVFFSHAVCEAEE